MSGERTAPRAARTTTGVRFAGRTEKGFPEEKALVWKDIEALCSEHGQVCGKQEIVDAVGEGGSIGAVRSNVLEGVHYDGRAQKIYMGLELIVLHLYFSVLENYQCFKQRMLSLDLFLWKTLAKNTNGAITT